MKDTVWEELTSDQQIPLNFDVLEDEFAAKATKPKSSKSSASTSKNELIMLIPVKRSQNIGVFMSRLKLTASEVSLGCRMLSCKDMNTDVANSSSSLVLR